MTGVIRRVRVEGAEEIIFAGRIGKLLIEAARGHRKQSLDRLWIGLDWNETGAFVDINDLRQFLDKLEARVKSAK